MNRVLAVLCVLASSAHAEPRSAERLTALDELVWALTATCSAGQAGDDVEQRQCRHLREARIAELAAGPLIVDADPDAFAVGAYNAAKQAVPVTLAACIRCGGVKLDGKRWLVTGDRPPTIGADGIAHGAVIYDAPEKLADAAAAAAWVKSVAHARAQLIVQLVPAKAVWHVGAIAGVSLAVVGFVVSNPCDGTVVISKPAIDHVPVDPSACASLPGATHP